MSKGIKSVHVDIFGLIVAILYVMLCVFISN